jgi:hypothetical protein
VPGCGCDAEGISVEREYWYSEKRKAYVRLRKILSDGECLEVKLQNLLVAASRWSYFSFEEHCWYFVRHSQQCRRNNVPNTKVPVITMIPIECRKYRPCFPRHRLLEELEIGMTDISSESADELQYDSLISITRSAQ